MSESNRPVAVMVSLVASPKSTSPVAESVVPIIPVNVPAAADSPPIIVPSTSPLLIYAATGSASVPNWSI